jgi:hypothetical protein
MMNSEPFRGADCCSEYFLKKEGVGKAVATAEPVGESGRSTESSPTEESLRTFVVIGHEGIQLMQGEVETGILAEQAECVGSDALPLPFRKQDDAHLGTQMAGLEILQIHEALGDSVAPFDAKTKLSVPIDVIVCSGKELAKGMCREGHGGQPVGPETGVVLHEIHRVEIFRLHGA